MNPHVYIIRGAPASGKGTIALEIAKSLPQPVVLIEQDKLRWGFHLIGRAIGDVSSDEHRFAYENTRMLYERYLDAGKYNIVVEGLFTWNDENSAEGSAKELIDLAQLRGFTATSIVLTAGKDELLRRNASRAYSVPSDEFESLYNGIQQNLDSSEVIIDSTDESIDETIAKLKSLLTL